MKRANARRKLVGKILERLPTKPGSYFYDRLGCFVYVRKREDGRLEYDDPRGGTYLIHPRLSGYFVK
jgi:hypothetical protein